MNSVEKETVLHCLKSMIDEEVCEECPLYGMTGTDHCEKDCVRLAINALEQEPCTDAISRQAACSSLICRGIDCKDCPFNNVFPDGTTTCLMAERIKELPPVKPQYTDAEIQKMQDLEFAEIQKAYEIGKEEGSSENPNKWIPVESALPEKNMACLVTVGKFKLTQMAMYSDLMGTIDHRIFYQGDYGYDSFEDITEYVKAWMPLPDPYKTSPTGEEVEE